MENQGLTNQVILIIGSGGMLFLATGIITFIYLYQRKLIKRKIAYQEIENLLRKQELKSAYALLEGQDMERQRIAEELHDNLGSVLVTLSMYAHSIQRAGTDEEREDFMCKIIAISTQATEVTRRISQKLDSGAMRHFGFVVAVKDLVQAVNKTNGIQIETHIDLQSEIPNEIGLNLYRVLQELINNTMKHACASKINIDLSQVKTEYISLIYEDNGTGFAISEVRHRGMGLRNIQARVDKMNGQVTFGEKSKTGFSAAFEIPLQ